jgi:hypothetical protein
MEIRHNRRRPAPSHYGGLTVSALCAIFPSAIRSSASSSTPGDGCISIVIWATHTIQFAWAVGGGIDLVASRRLSVRVGQFDYERVGVPNTLGPSYAPVGGYRFSAGIVFKL